MTYIQVDFLPVHRVNIVVQGHPWLSHLHLEVGADQLGR